MTHALTPVIVIWNLVHTVCQRSPGPYYIVVYGFGQDFLDILQYNICYAKYNSRGEMKNERNLIKKGVIRLFQGYTIYLAHREYKVLTDIIQVVALYKMSQDL